MSKGRLVFGFNTPDVPTTDFSRPPFNVHKVWPLIGPTVDRNLDKLPLRTLICLCYVQGLENGAAGQRPYED